MNKKIPKISIITPSFNQGEFLEKTIQSVIEQDYPNLEYIIIDGGSIDNSVDIIKKYEKQISYWVSEADKGQSDAINKGIKKSTGDIIAWLNSDDFYYPETLKIVSEAFNAYPSAGLYTGNGYLVDRNGNKLRQYANSVGFEYDALLRGSCFILQPSTFINRNAVNKLGLLDETLHYGMDLEYWLRISKEFEVISINAFLSAFRWYDEVKTNEGFKRWIELWNIYRRYTDDEITPGLLVEFFSILKKDFVQKSLELPVKELAEKGFQYTYALMQNSLCLDDCIPKGKGTIFEPTRQISGVPYPAERLTAGIKGSNLKVDILLQATGEHAWGVGKGWENGAKKLGVFNRSFAPRSNWGDINIRFDDGLTDYLKNPQSDVILLLGFDWHSQMLHMSEEWQQRWLSSKVKKVLYIQESIENNCRLFNNDDMKRTAASAINISDLVVYTDVTDEKFLRQFGKPILWLPFGADETVFKIKKEFEERINRPFFRGKVTPFYTNKTYEQRRRLLDFLLQNRLIDLIEYKDKPVTAEEIADDFNAYQIAVNLPSLFSNHPTRVYEALACGTALITNRTGIDEVDNLFQHGKHLLYYSNELELREAIVRLQSDQNFLKELAEAGHRYVLENFTLDKQLMQILEHLEINYKSEIKDKIEAKLDNKSKIVIDGVIFQLQHERPSGIYRVWESLLKELSKTELAKRILLLDRGNTAPEIEGINKREIGIFNFNHFEANSFYLGDICKEENAELFLSTYYTSAAGVTNILLLHDFIPEVMKWDLLQPEWLAKVKSINSAHAFLSVSKSTEKDFRKFYPSKFNSPVFLVPNAVGDTFRLHTSEEIEIFKRKYGIEKPYFMLVGYRSGYKNAIQFFKAFNKLKNKNNFEIVMTGGTPELEEEFKPFLKGIKHGIYFFPNEELSTAYSGAQALIYPSKYEGFGLPVLEAMKSGCPVITCNNSSLSFVAGDAALYVKEDDIQAMKNALEKTKDHKLKNKLVEKGIKQAEKFSWADSCRLFVDSVETILTSIDQISFDNYQPMNEHQLYMYSILKDQNYGKSMSKLQRLLLLKQPPDVREFENTEKIFLGLKKNSNLSMPQKISYEETRDAYFCYLRGLIEFDTQNFEEALNAFYFALNFGLTHWRIGFLFALAAYKLHKFELAKDMLQKVLQANQKYTEAALLLEEILKVSDRSSVKVSAIVSTYNSERFIEGCLNDLVNQTLYAKGELEIVVINSGSKQNEDAVINRFREKYSNIKYIKTSQREGVYKAWNRGIKAASGKYITNANTDDRHKPGALEKLAAALDESDDAALVYADSKVTDKENENFDSENVIGFLLWPEFERKKLFEICYVGPQPMWRKELHDKYGYFDESFKSAGDYEFWLRISEKEKFLHVNEILGLYLLSPNSIEHANDKISFEESEKARARYWKSSDARPAPSGAYLVFYKSSEKLNSSPQFSVIVPTYNRPAELKRALNSLSAQIFKNFEVIVVNDGKTDVSKVLAEFDGKLNYQLVHHIINRERSASRNDGIKISAGKFITFLDDDDIYYPDHLQVLYNNTSPEVKVVYTDAVRAVYDKKDGGYELIRKYVPYSIEYDRSKLLIGNVAPINCFAIERSLLFKAGLFNEDFSVLEDWDLLLRISELTPFVHVKSSTVEVEWKLDGNSTSAKNSEAWAQIRNQLYERYAVELASIPNKDEIISEFNEIWENDFEPKPPEVSIIAVTFNQREYTKQFLDSVKKYTDRDYEIIVVDNASSDSTLEMLCSEEYSNLNLRIIKNETNLGFPKAVNEGIIASRGKYVLLANNDIVVTKGWLDRMIEVAEMDERIGIVGPISNSVSWYQIDKDAAYSNIEEMHNYVQSIRKKNKGEVLYFPRLAFLCTLIKRKVIDELGGLDERFSPGNFEDDDFCLRAQLAGYKSAIAKDVFVHHYGSVSFTANGTENYTARLETNKKIFVEKWGADPVEIWLKGKTVNNRKLFYSIDKNEFKRYLERSITFFEDRDYQASLESLEKAIGIYPLQEQNSASKEKLLIMAGNLCLVLKNFPVAQTYFEDALKLNSDSSDACTGLGKTLLLAEDLESSKVMLEWAVKNDKKNDEAVLLLKQVNNVLGYAEDHNSVLIGQLNDASPDPSQLKNNVNSLAVEKLAEIINDEPDGSSTNEISIENNEFDECSIFPKAGELIDEAYLLFEKKKFEQALARLTEAEVLFNGHLTTEKNKEFASAFFNLRGFNYLGLNDLENARTCFEKALNLNPNSSQACTGLAEIFFLQRMNREAKSMYEWGITNDPNNRLARYGLEKVNKLLGLPGEHLGDF